MLDVQFVRSQFPALSDGWAYFDNAGGSRYSRASLSASPIIC